MALDKFDSQKALKVKEKYYLPLEKKVFEIFSDIIYKPIFVIIKKNIGSNWLKENSKKEKLDLIKAIRKGKVQYTGKWFEGSFNASISKQIKAMGGTWNKTYKRWYLKPEQLDYDTRMAIAESQVKDRAINEAIVKYLDKLEGQLKKADNTNYDLTMDYDAAIRDLENQFNEGIKNITVAPEITEEQIKELKEQWSENMNIYIKGWTEESIKRLRKRVWNNAFNGFRSKNLVQEVMYDYNISFNKAKFLARQETSLLMSKFRESRYKSAGVQKYRWSTSQDERVRSKHAALNGQIISWDNPPIVDELGHRAHAGEDFNCRCVAIPIID